MPCLLVILQVLPESRVENFASVTEGSLTQLHSILHLRGVTDADAGLYQCVVSNTLGSAYSTKADITVHGELVQVANITCG